MLIKQPVAFFNSTDVLPFGGRVKTLQTSFPIIRPLSTPFDKTKFWKFYLTLMNAECNLDKISVHKELALVHEDPKDRWGIHVPFLKEDRSIRRNLQNEDYQETLNEVHFSQKD